MISDICGVVARICPVVFFSKSVSLHHKMDPPNFKPFPNVRKNKHVDVSASRKSAEFPRHRRPRSEIVPEKHDGQSCPRQNPEIINVPACAEIPSLDIDQNYSTEKNSVVHRADSWDCDTDDEFTIPDEFSSAKGGARLIRANEDGTLTPDTNSDSNDSYFIVVQKNGSCFTNDPLLKSKVRMIGESVAAAARSPIPRDFRTNAAVREKFLNECEVTKSAIVHGGTTISTSELLLRFPPGATLADMIVAGNVKVSKFLTHRRIYGPLLEFHIAAASTSMTFPPECRPDPLPFALKCPDLVEKLSPESCERLVQLLSTNRSFVEICREKHFPSTVIQRTANSDAATAFALSNAFNADNASPRASPVTPGAAAVAPGRQWLTFAKLLIDTYLNRGMDVDAVIFAGLLNSQWIFAFLYSRRMNVSRREIDAYVAKHFVPERCKFALTNVGLY